STVTSLLDCPCTLPRRDQSAVSPAGRPVRNPTRPLQVGHRARLGLDVSVCRYPARTGRRVPHLPSSTAIGSGAWSRDARTPHGVTTFPRAPARARDGCRLARRGLTPTA